MDFSMDFSDFVLFLYIAYAEGMRIGQSRRKKR